MKKLTVVIAAVCIAIGIGLGIYFSYFHAHTAETLVVKVCAADSLARLLQTVAHELYQKYHMKVLIETAGSVKIVRRITELHELCDVVMLADYRLIPLYLMPKYASWYAVFTSNTVVLAYTPKSRYANIVEKDPNKWYLVLEMPGVRFAFSNPNKDPCGYRSLGVIGLAALYYHNMSILRDLLLKNLEGVKVSIHGDRIDIYVYPSIAPNTSKIVIRPKSIDFAALLESHDIDYAFMYRSSAVQQGLKYIELPPQINLGSPSMDSFYSHVVVHILCGTKFERTIPMKSVAYGLTILSNAPHPRAVKLFVEYMLSSSGAKLLKDFGFSPIHPAICRGSVPSWLSGLCR